jgi:hypothetical protein
VSEPTPVQKFFGAGLMAVGGLIAALCGACSVVLVGSSILSSLKYGGGFPGLAGTAILVTLVGGIPTFVGVLIARAGWRRYRPPGKVGRAQIAVFSDPPDGDAP